MFSKLIFRNSRRNRKENGLLFGSLLISIVAFYMILSLSRQDVMFFLAEMESDAINKLLTMVPVLYGMTLFLLFFLIFFASRFHLERRGHEFGVYLMMGMRRIRLFVLLLAEDFFNSILSLLIGLPAAILLSELTSLFTARMVGIGIIGHQASFSPQAVLWTMAGFLAIRFAAFLLLSGRISRQEIGSLLVQTPEGSKKQMPRSVYLFSLFSGALLLLTAYGMAISGVAWHGPGRMALTVIAGLTGTLLFFYGLRILIGFLAKTGGTDNRLHVFNFRQIQENVIHRSGALAVCSLLTLAALCCFGSGLAIARFYGESEPHVLDYTFQNPENETDIAPVLKTLHDSGLDGLFSSLFEMKVGHIRTAESISDAFSPEPLLSALREMPPSVDRDILLNNLSYETSPYLISLSSYNRLLAAAGLPGLVLDTDEAAVYMDLDFTTPERLRLINEILGTRPQTMLAGKPCYLTGSVLTTSLVTDRSITLSFALIVPDERFESETLGKYSVFLNATLAESATEGGSLLSAISDTNQKLKKTGLSFESYLQNMGRQLFYMVAASYITIYLAIIFLVMANTIIGVQFLMNQQKSGRRYRTLIHLGAAYKTLCRSARQQITWYFGLPVTVAALSSLFGVQALLTGILSARAKNNLSEMIFISAAMIFVLCVVEYIYIAAVKRSSDRYLLTLMVPEREE